MTAEEILNKKANSLSYDDWAELMYDSHSEWQVKYTIEAMQEYADQEARKAFEAANELEEHTTGFRSGYKFKYISYDDYKKQNHE
jgi:hypothetical protein